jgi:glyoxylase-like metal-dependent hydrolase (beta-lactamase superfamily II)
MNIFRKELAPIGANCYIVDNGNGEALAVDVGGDAELVIGYLEDNNLQLRAILLTHGHFDHIGGVEDVRAATGAVVYIAKEDADMLNDPEKNRSGLPLRIETKHIESFEILGDELEVGGLKVKIIKTPGHTEGCVCFQIEDCLFTGDTLFNGNIGRIDFPTSNREDMIKSLKKLVELDGDFKVYPGHNKATTLDFERKNNKYLVNLQ